FPLESRFRRRLGWRRKRSKSVGGALTFCVRRELIQNDELEAGDSVIDGVVGDEPSRPVYESGSCLHRIGSSEIVIRSQSGGAVRYRQRRGNPLQVRIACHRAGQL